MTLTNFRWGFSGETQTLRVEGGRVVSRIPARPDDSGTDLGGAYLLPAFVDNHCHILPMGLDIRKLHLGLCDTHEAVLDAVRDRLAAVPEAGWLLAVHYDQTRYAAGRHLTRIELDAISSDVPILLRHVNGHASVANSAALLLARVSEDVVDPGGGSYCRGDDGRLNGVLLEAAHEQVTKAVANPSLEEMTQAILDASTSMAAMGIGTAADMMTGRYNLLDELEAYRLASERGPVRLRLYLQWSEVFGPRAVPMSEIQDRIRAMDPARCRVAGIKIFADGAIGSATAAIYGRYSGNGERGTGSGIWKPKGIAAAGSPFPAAGLEVSGQLIYTPDKLRQMVLTAHEAGYQVAIHSIGDHATDLVLDAFESTGEPSRHRIEHAMMLSDDQIERMARLNPYCSMQPEFLMRFGHSYLRQLGPERAAKLKRMRSVKDAGIRLSLSSDRPIVAGDPWDGILTACNRPEGFHSSESLTRQEALCGYLRSGAECLGDSDLGGLDPGDRANYCLWDSDPMTGRPALRRHDHPTATSDSV